jgi:hypothetical protein
MHRLRSDSIQPTVSVQAHGHKPGSQVPAAIYIPASLSQLSSNEVSGYQASYMIKNL